MVSWARLPNRAEDCAFSATLGDFLNWIGSQPPSPALVPSTIRVEISKRKAAKTAW
jgi:hypothetical protein